MNKIVAFLLALALIPGPVMAQSFVLGNQFALPAPVAAGSCLLSNGLNAASVWGPCAGGPTGSTFPTGISVGTSGSYTPNIATWGVTDSGGTTETAFADAARTENTIQCSGFGLVNNNVAQVGFCIDRHGNVGAKSLRADTGSVTAGSLISGASTVPTNTNAIEWGTTAGFGQLWSGSGVSLGVITCALFAVSSSLGGTAMCADESLRVSFSANIMATSGIIASPTAGNGTPSYVDASVNNASMRLGQIGAPAGPCTSGSLYTRSDGGVGSTLYVCESSAWVAATTP